MPGRVIAPITHVQAPNEGNEAALGGLLTHVGVWPWGSMMDGAVVAGAAPPQLLQLVLGPLQLALAPPWAHCTMPMQVFLGVRTMQLGTDHCILATMVARTTHYKHVYLVKTLRQSLICDRKDEIKDTAEEE